MAQTLAPERFLTAEQKQIGSVFFMNRTQPAHTASSIQCHNACRGELRFELRDLRASQGKTLLSRGSRPHLSSVLWRAARGNTGLSQRLPVSAAGQRTREAACGGPIRRGFVVLAG